MGDVLDQLMDKAKAALGEVRGEISGGGGRDTTWSVDIGERAGVPWPVVTIGLLVLVFFLIARRG